MGTVIISILALLALLLICGLILICWIYYKAPIEQLREIYEYHARSDPAERFRKVGLKVTDNTSVEELPGFAIIALLLHEDDLFFCHKGFNWREIGNRLRAHFNENQELRGGSSIVQQFAKTALIPIRGKDAWFRKLVEAVYTIKLEKTLSKTEILILYMSCLRLGALPKKEEEASIYGIRAATRHYFNKEPANLTLTECMYLFALIPAAIWFDQNVRILGNIDVFRYQNAYNKFRDLFRIYVTTWGWSSLDKLDHIGSKEAVDFMKNFKNYTPQPLPAEFENALRVRSLVALQELRELVEQQWQDSEFRKSPNHERWKEWARLPFSR